MTTSYLYREGDTDPITIYLLEGTLPANITGYTKISIFLRSEDATEESEASTDDDGITVTDEATGVIALHPDLLTEPLLYAKVKYFGYVIVEDGDGNRASFPADELEFIMKERFGGDG